MNEMIKDFDELYEDIVSSNDTERMEDLGGAYKWLFGMVAERQPEIAEKVISMLESSKWNNYVSKIEAKDIVAKLKNQNGTTGPHWDYDTMKGAVEGLGKPLEEFPFYNTCSLWVTMNMLYSDHANSAGMYVPKEDFPKFFYMMALEKLKDPDKPKFIRKYFNI